ncbi:phage holin family protein [Sphingorhabdus sp. SMR4y]|uniref:phage holin family protein n=1 Tax=Sphingorhabdus sp. SMR4y TaxID=2584094 RepID=UPI000B5CD394|nr:phage holin family protein [Sphingorhabdus sp. SMR4y]ASK87797.1 putative Actinobacterial holin-X, holin superfamily III [Sphingorhabdus sp. SMR4y]
MLQDKEIPVLDEDRLSEDPAAAGAGAAESGSLKSQLAGLVEDVRVLAYAEVEYYRTKLSVNMAATKRIVTLAGVGLIFGVMAIIALILGLLLVLADFVGPLAATGIVTGLALLVAAVTLGMATKQAKKLPLDETDA